MPLWDPLFGLDFVIRNNTGVKNHTLLADTRTRFQALGNTFSTVLAGRTVHLTIEPEILKTVQSLNFNHWHLSDRRKVSFIPLLGHGIFTTDDAPWAHSREMLRPNFVRSQLADPDTFEHHASHLIQAIPRDGSTVNLQELFFRLTIDSATEFLFGQSTYCLAPGISTISAGGFAAAWNRCLEVVAFRSRFGLVTKLVPFPQFSKDVKYVHGMVSLVCWCDNG